jgi:hypothetical protein
LFFSQRLAVAYRTLVRVVVRPEHRATFTSLTPAQKRRAGQIARRNGYTVAEAATLLFASLLDMAVRKGAVKIPEATFYIGNAVYWARVRGAREPIREQLMDRIR